MIEKLEELAAAYGNRFLLEPAPDNDLPEHGMRAVDAMRLIGEELVLDGIPQRNLATFVTTWMEPEAQRIIAENLHRNFIDHAEYPQTAEIEQRCIRMLASLFHAPGETTGARTQGSSEAMMLGALSLKWKWRERREKAGKYTSQPNLIFGGDVHVVWEKFCRYFDVEPRIIPLQPDKYTIGPEEVEPHVDENTIGVAAVLGTTFTGHSDDVRASTTCWSACATRRASGADACRRGQRRLRVAVPVPGHGMGFPARAGALDQHLGPQVRARLPGHRLAGVPREERPGRRPRLRRELPGQDRRYVHAELLNRLRDGARPVLQLRAFGRAGYRYIMETMQANARMLAQRITEIGEFQLVGEEGTEQLPLVAFQLEGDHPYDEFDVASQLAAERGWMAPAYKLPPNADHVTIMRALVKLTLGHTLASTLADDIAEACETLSKKGGLHELDRKRVKTGTGY